MALYLGHWNESTVSPDNFYVSSWKSFIWLYKPFKQNFHNRAQQFVYMVGSEKLSLSGHSWQAHTILSLNHYRSTQWDFLL